MNCEEFKKTLSTRAGSESDHDIDRRMLEHVKSCEQCARTVAGPSQLKSQLNQVFVEERAPSGLRFRVHAELMAAARDEARRPSRVQRWVIPLGVAAAVAFVALASILFDRSASELSGGPKNAVEARFVKAVRKQHDGCTRMVAARPDEGLSIDEKEVREKLSKELRLPVLAPDLADRGFVMVGADLCGLNGMPGAHVIYRESGGEGRLLSVFTVRPVTSLKPTHGFHAGGHDCFLCAGRDSTVVAWHESQATYVVCGAITAREFRELVWTGSGGTR